MLMDPDVGCVDEDVFEIGIVRQGLENPFPDAFLRPTPKARVDAVPFTERARQITPGRAGSRDPQDSFDEQPIVSGRGAGITHFARQFWLNAFPLPLAQDRANQG
jgi:hypothetical protein